MVRRLLLTAFAVFSLMTVRAQTADWRVSPQYTAIEPFAEGLYKVREGRKSGIIDDRGTVLVPAKYDRITPFYEGLAVIYDKTSEGDVFRGVISQTGEANFADDTYYLLPDCLFYSEGLIPVQEPGGKYGYLTTLCSPAFKFFKEEARPFSEGVAAVGINEDFKMIGTHGEDMRVILPNGEYVWGGTNYYNGEALFWDEDLKCYIRDSSGEFIRLNKKESPDVENYVPVDYLFRYDTGEGDDPEYYTYTPVTDKDWTPVQKDGRWTFSNSAGKPLTPYRYDSVKPFADGLAIASTNGKFGLLEVVEDNSTFFSTVPNPRHSYSPGKSVKCSFILSTPEKWADQPYTVLIQDLQSGKDFTYERKGNQYTFTAEPKGDKLSEEKTYNVVVQNNGINIWEGQVNYEFTQRAKLQAAIRLQNADADSNDKCYVVATVKNPSSVPVTTTVTLSGGGNKASFSGKSVSVTIPPYGTKSVSGAFTVHKVELNGWCAVSTSEGASARRNGLQLKPF